MIKQDTKRVLIIVLIILLCFIICGTNRCLALSDVTEGVAWDSWEPQVNGTEKLEEKTNIITSTIRIIGMVISVISLSIIGIKYMLGSIEEKAQYKQTMAPWIVGATMVFAMTTIPTIIYETVIGESKKSEDYGSHMEGADAAAIWVVDIYNDLCKDAGGASEHINELLKEKVKEQQNLVDSSSDYGKGYMQFLSQVENENSPASYAMYASTISQKLAAGTITTDNIISEYKTTILNVISSTEPIKSAMIGAVNRLRSQLTEWDMIDDLVASNTWEEYTKGYDAAADFVNGHVSKDTKILKEKINAGKTEVQIYRSEIAYCKGYYDFLEETYTNSDQYVEEKYTSDKQNKLKSHIKACVDINEETVTNINLYNPYLIQSTASPKYKNMITPTNIERKISNAKNATAGTGLKNAKPEQKAEIKRLELQKYIWNKDQFKF